MKVKKLFTILPLLMSASLAFGEAASLDEIRAQLEELKSQVESMNEVQQTAAADILNLKKLKVSGYFQGRYEWHQDRPADAVTPPSTADKQNGFFIRRGRIKFTYSAAPTSEFVIYPDMSTKDGVNLKEAYIKLTEPWTGHGSNLVFGQQNWFFGREIERSSSVREFPERARVYGKAVFDGERDKGARLEFPDLLISGLNLKVGMFNGAGIKSPQTFDNDHYKHYMGRLAFSLGWVDVGVSGENGRRFAKIGAGNGFATKKHIGADMFFYYELPILGGGSLGGEWLSGEGVQNPAVLHARNEGWLVSSVQNLGEFFQIAARYDEYDPNRLENTASATGDKIRTTTLAGHYFWDGNTRVTYAWERPVNENPYEVRDNTQTLQLQYKF